MARPAALQLLRKGKLLVGSVFPRFVDTWNWLVCSFDSMIGDRDLNPQQGYIYMDRSNPDRPVIRLDATRLQKATGGGASYVGPFEPSFDSAGCITSVGGGLWPYGRNYYASVTVNASALVSSGLIGIEITHASASTGASAEIVLISASASSVASVTNTAMDKTTIPLYTVSGGKIAVDYRPLLALAIRE